MFKSFHSWVDGFLIVILIFCVSTFGFGLTKLNSHIEWSIFILEVSGIFSVSIATLFFLPLKHRINGSLMIFSVAVSLFCVEWVLGTDWYSNMDWTKKRANRHTLARIKAAHEIGINFDERNKFDVYSDMKNRGEEVFPSTHSAVGLWDHPSANQNNKGEFGFLPLSGISQVTTVYCNESGVYMIYKSDRYGFNNYDPVYENKGRRILLVGDSFTQGACVKPEDDIAGKLRQRGYNAINLGIGHNGPLMELATLKEYGVHLKPSVVLWMYHKSDWKNLLEERRSQLLLQYLNEDFTQNLLTRQKEIDDFWKQAIKKKEKEMTIEGEKAGNDHSPLGFKAFFTLFRLRGLTGLDKRSFGMEKKAKLLFHSILETAQEITAGFGGKLYFVYLPDHSSFGKGPPPSRDWIMQILEELNIPMINIFKHFKAHKDPHNFFPFRLHGHYTAKGYEQVAEVLIKEVLQHWEHQPNSR